MRYVIVTAPDGYRDTVEAVLSSHEVSQIWSEPVSPGADTFTLRFIAAGAGLQKLLDDLQRTISSAESATIHTMNIDSWFPQKIGVAPVLLSRDELLSTAEQGARLDWLYLLLVGLSTIVAGIGLLEDNLAVVIGAMVIAPLLGPNLSSALGIALGEFRIARRAGVAMLAGIVIALIVSFLLGIVWPVDSPGEEVMNRTMPGIDTPLLALASGAAAVLSLTTGIHGVLVGVMVAVALLPPLASAGILIGLGLYEPSFWALVLFGINAAAINLAAHITLYLLAVKPRTAAMGAVAAYNVMTSAIFWSLVLIGLSWAAIQFR